MIPRDSLLPIRQRSPSSHNHRMDSASRHPHLRLNPLSGSYVLCSPQRARRPWLGANETVQHHAHRPDHDAVCYLCPRNQRAHGEANPDYDRLLTFENDFPALEVPESDSLHPKKTTRSFLSMLPARGCCHVHVPTPHHGKRLCDLPNTEVGDFIRSLQRFQLDLIDKHPSIQSMLLFENRGPISGQSSPHPHWQSWATVHIPRTIETEMVNMAAYTTEVSPTSCLLCEYMTEEMQHDVRIVWKNDSFLLLVPFWAYWPFETLLLPLRHQASFLQLGCSDEDEKTERTINEVSDFAEAIQMVVGMYDLVFNCEFSYTMGLHQHLGSIVQRHPFHWHAHYQPMLQRGPEVRKHAVGYDVYGDPQRDLTPEQAAERLKACVAAYVLSRENK